MDYLAMDYYSYKLLFLKTVIFSKILLPKLQEVLYNTV